MSQKHLEFIGFIKPSKLHRKKRNQCFFKTMKLHQESIASVMKDNVRVVTKKIEFVCLDYSKPMAPSGIVGLLEVYFKQHIQRIPSRILLITNGLID